jgi:hypothetical protein
MRPGVISLLYPTARQTEFLRACLWSGAEAQAAWSRWCATPGDARQALTSAESGSKALLALLHEAVRRNDLAADASVRSLLAVAAMTEQRRNSSYDEICARACSALAAASIRFIVLKGTGLAGVVYPAPALRHSHDIDVLVEADARDRAAAAVGSAGFTRAPSAVDRPRFLHASGLPLELHVGICRLPQYALPPPEIWQRSTRCQTAAGHIPTFGLADHLVHVLRQASCCASRDTLIWVCDAWYLIARAAELDWNVVLRTAAGNAAALPIAGLVEFLAVQLRAPVPAFVSQGLSDAARVADRVTDDAILDGIRAGRRGRFRAMLGHARTNRERTRILRWAFRRWRSDGRGASGDIAG